MDIKILVESSLYVVVLLFDWRFLTIALPLLIVFPAIGNAIDEDGSGYVSVQETNRFFSKKPEGWSTPQWLA
jgi:hypothetical protein